MKKAIIFKRRITAIGSDNRLMISIPFMFKDLVRHGDYYDVIITKSADQEHPTKYTGYNKRYPEKKKAMGKVYYALQTGKIVKRPCEVCGNIESFAHHNWGYKGANALRIMWLCDPHHKEQHKKMKTETKEVI